MTPLRNPSIASSGYLSRLGATADRSPAAVKIEERIGWESLWENVCGERCMRKIWWLVKALCHPCNGLDCPHVTISDDVLNSIRSYNTVVL